jgi:hypothetical protein
MEAGLQPGNRAGTGNGGTRNKVSDTKVMKDMILRGKAHGGIEWVKARSSRRHSLLLCRNCYYAWRGENITQQNVAGHNCRATDRGAF